MKKLVIIIVAILAIVFFGAPYYTGKVAEAETLKMVAKMNESPTEYGSTEILEYDRSFRNTSARYEYIPPVQFATIFPDLDRITFVCDSNHGITGIEYTCRFEGESSYSKFIVEKLEGKDPLSITGSISAFGGLTQTLSLDEIKGIEIEGATLNLPKTVISFESDANISEFKIIGGSEAFEMHGNGEAVSIGELSIDVDFKRVAELLFTGDMQLSLAHLNASGATGETAFKSLSVSSTTNEHGSTLSSNVLFSVGQVISPSMPFENVENLTFGFEIKGVEQQALIEYQELAQQIQRDTIASLESNSEPQVDADQMAQLLPALEKMLTKGLQVNSNFEASLNGKANRASINLKLVEALTLAQMPMFITAPDEAMKKIDASISASLDKQVVDNQPMAAVFIAQSPLVAAGADNYALDLKLGEAIELNGKPISFSELQTLIFSSLPF